jgi:alpha-tubulin suppressor-like RCC1 family protein
VAGETVQLNAVAMTQHCDFEFCSESQVGAAFSWLSSNTGVVTVSGGLVLAVGRGTAVVTAEVASGVKGAATIRVGSAYVPLGRSGPGGRCALSDSGAAYCWGSLWFSSPDTGFGPSMPRLVATTATFASLAVGSAVACGITTDAQGYCWGQSDPAVVPGGLRFRSLSPGRRDAVNGDNAHTCGVAVDGTAWCWGADDAGQLGTAATLSTCNNGEISHTYPCSTTPVPVTGAPAFAVISAGGTHTCALTADGTAYCWGNNIWGQLGDSSTVSREQPKPVRGAPALASLVAGADYTCGLSSAGAAFCWGHNHTGQLGIGAQDYVPHPMPASVAGNVSWTSLDASQRTCGLTRAGAAYCWGSGVTVPTPVAGSLVFRSLGVGPG